MATPESSMQGEYSLPLHLLAHPIDPKYSGIGNTASWIPFPTSQTSAETVEGSGENLSSHEDEGEQEQMQHT